ncbi:MAG: PepSY-associated TM helix domain-containing protein [Candidatus Kapaibacterium sp.]
MKKLYKISKWIHKWLSLLLSVFLIWMAFSGILLNHPELISGISVPQWMFPKEYDLVNWNRSAIIQAEFSKKHPGLAFYGGHEGVIMTTDGAYSFMDLNSNGYPSSAYLKKTKSISLYENNDESVLFAGNFDGLYRTVFGEGSWEKISLPSSFTKVMKLLRTDDSLIVATDSEIFISQISNQEMNFNKVPLDRIEDEPKMTLIELFFQLHSGELWGLPGKILFDIAGLILVFLCISGLYIWISPKYRKIMSRLNLKRGRIRTGWFFRYHLKLGIWSFGILLIFAITGLYMRPPMIAQLLGGEVSVKFVPAPKPSNPWKHRIRNIAYDKSTNRVIIDTKDGYWVSDGGLYGKFTKQLPPVPIFAMGATVLDSDYEGNLLLGSFAGLFRVNNSGLMAENMLESDAPIVSSVRPGANLITGYFKEPSGYEYVTTHFKGLINVHQPNEHSGKYQMPEFMKKNYSMPLWNYLFEIHNGRIFQALIGDFYILLIPLSALAFTLVIVTGVFDWVYKKYLKSRF